MSNDFKEAIVSAFLYDFDLAKRKQKDSVHSASNFDIDNLCAQIISEAKDRSVVYTAFDGDLQQLCNHMRAFVLSENKIPANPDSILGYKDAVDAHQNKQDVLRDDLTILRGCDEIWVFTDAECTPHSVQSLAEGVIIELMFFLKRKPNNPVNFVSSSSLIDNAKASKACKYLYDYKSTAEALGSDQKRILEFANSGMKIDKTLQPALFFICDPLDYKYARWLRPTSYRENRVPIVPSLAIDISDLDISSSDSLPNILISWAKLMMLSKDAWYLPPTDSNRSPSIIASILEGIWQRLHGRDSISRKDWHKFKIPKLIQRELWPITDRERKL